MRITDSFFEGKSALHVAVQHGHDSIVELLIERKANTTAIDNDQRTPLHYAAQHGEVTITRLLIEHHTIKVVDGTECPENIKAAASFVRLADCFGVTALHDAAKGGYCDLVDILIKYNADVNAVDSRGQSALHYSAAAGHDYVVDILIDEGAHVSTLDEEKRTAVHLASITGNSYCTNLLGSNGMLIRGSHSTTQQIWIRTTQRTTRHDTTRHDTTRYQP
jgi:ankyrin repeat protein